jgi:hypothetical protein
MKSIRSRGRSLFATGLAGAALVVLGVRAFGEGDDPQVKRVAVIKDVMFAVNNTESSVFAQLKEDLGTKLDDEGWEAVHGRAAMIVEAGNILLGLKPPMGADDAAGLAKWKKHVLDYRGCGEAILDAANKKDAAGALAATKGLSGRCSECHKDHRKE